MSRRAARSESKRTEEEYLPSNWKKVRNEKKTTAAADDDDNTQEREEENTKMM